MRLLRVGMLLASLPSAALAQTPGPPANSWSTAPQPDEHTTPMPPPNAINTAPAPQYDPSTQAAPDESVTATPLPPPDNSTDPAQDLVPNPLDSPAAPATQTTSKPERPQGQPERGGWVQMGTATLQALDKINARSTTLAVKVGDTGHFGSLDIGVRGCFVRTSDSAADATAYLVIRDHRTDAPSFTGWMVRSAPSMSMMAHPIYDVRVAGCAP